MKERETIDLENNGERAKQSGRGRSSPSSVPSRLAVIISRQTEEESVPPGARARRQGQRSRILEREKSPR